MTFFLGGTVRVPGVTLFITNRFVSNLVELSSIEHEEADTRIFAHLPYSVQDRGCTKAILSPPTAFGQALVDGKLCPILITIPGKPNIQRPPSCKCKTSKWLKNCSCVKSRVPCCVRCFYLGRKPSCGRIIEDTSSTMTMTQLAMSFQLLQLHQHSCVLSTA